MTLSKMTTLKLDIDRRGVARLYMARPETLNAFDETMIAELDAAFSAFDKDDGVRVVVLGAEGRAFSAGADLRWMERASGNTQEENLADAHRFARMMHVMKSCRKPVIARVQGAAYGGGVGLCCACDIVLATPNARFAVSEARFGILPAVIGPYLNNAVGKRHALRMALTAEQIDAARAERIGLVHQVVEEAQLDAEIETLIGSLLSNGPAALGEIKQLFSRLTVGEIDDATRDLTAQTISRVRSTDEAKEGFAAFFAKRPAAWRRS
jgi:methylglutaconyl-CoA hydratase